VGVISRALSDRVKRRYRLRRKAEFQSALKGRRIYSGQGLVALAIPSSRFETRVGVTVSRKLRSAVERNRARRRLRELARLAILEADSGVPGLGIRYDVVLIARPAALTLRYADLKEEAEQAARRLTGARLDS
jgi:ribonuclease P protein component